MDVRDLADHLDGRPFVALTGAGCSTESGIPDYRGPETARRARNPVQYREFLTSPTARARYWARSLVGWPRFAAARPNAAHTALASLETGPLLGVITQNVDRLHQAAGSARVVELHGALADVTCLRCGRIEARSSLQERLVRLNPQFVHRRAESAPDGDADLEDVDGFRVAPCLTCGGDVKPAVVFFGENVPRPRVDAARALVGRAEALLVVGSSLTVFSGLRFVREAHRQGIPVAIVNLGPTRGDALATITIDARAGDVLPALAVALAPARSGDPSEVVPRSDAGVG